MLLPELCKATVNNATLYLMPVQNKLTVYSVNTIISALKFNLITLVANKLNILVVAIQTRY